jgi:hypothetical protein
MLRAAIILRDVPAGKCNGYGHWGDVDDPNHGPKVACYANVSATIHQ